MPYLITWDLSDRTSGRFEVASLDEIPKALAKLLMHLNDDRFYDANDDLFDHEGNPYLDENDFSVTAVYEVETVPFKAKDLLAKAIPLVKAKLDEQAAFREQRKKEQERREYERLSRRFGAET